MRGGIQAVIFGPEQSVECTVRQPKLAVLTEERDAFLQRIQRLPLHTVQRVIGAFERYLIAHIFVHIDQAALRMRAPRFPSASGRWPETETHRAAASGTGIPPPALP